MPVLDSIDRGDFEQVQVLRSPGAGLTAVIAVHDTRMGPAFGGIRRRRYADLGQALEDALRLARAMTLKCAIANIPAGGGKAVILDREELDRRAAYGLLGRHVEAMGGRFYTGPDLGTSDEDLLAVAEQTGFVARPGARGPGDLAESTALGVLSSLRATAAFLGRDLPGLVVAVQGLGAVGMKLSRMLADEGASLLVSDLMPERVDSAASECGARPVPVGEILDVSCDVLAPCALGGVITEEVAERLPARAICGAANNLLASPEAGRILHRRGVPAAPDFVANAGALIHGALFHLTGEVPPRSRIAGLGAVVAGILEESAASGVPPGEVALNRAKKVLGGYPPRPWFPERTP
ncbi:MAG: Glu/Leu/Phe/Val dehydrogenase [Planctomycetota bacterium]